MSKFRILSIFLAVGLLVGALGVGPVLAGQIDVTGLDTRDASYAPAQASADAVDLDDGEVKWTSANGEDITVTKADAAVVFYIKDNALESPSEEQIATWSSDPPNPTNDVGNGYNVLTGGSIPTPSDFNPMSTTTPNPPPSGFTLTGPAVDEDEDEDTGLDSDSDDYRDNEGFQASTFFGAGNDDDPNPILEVTSVKVHVNGAKTTITSRHVAESDNDLVAIIGGAESGGYAEVRFTHHVRDIHDDRAHVFSSSDPDGEEVTIYEVTKLGAEGGKYATSSISQVFYGSLMLSRRAETQGTNGDGVWVQDGDTVTVNYLDDEGEIVDTDTLTVDSVAPEISGLAPADGTTTSTKNPTLEFTATDSGSTIPRKGVEDAITIRFGLAVDDDGDPLDEDEDGVLDGINNDDFYEVDDDDLSILGTGTGFRVIFTTTDDWEDVEGLEDEHTTNDDGNKVFVIGVWVEDTAGNTASAATTVIIDTTLPKVAGADTGYGWVDGKQKKGVVNAVRVTMNESIDPDSVQGSDFEIDNVAAVDAVVGTKDHAKNIYLTTASDLDPADKPKVEIVDDVSDMAGNEVATDKAGSSTTAKDGIAPSVTVSVDDQLLVAEDKVTITVEVNEKLKSNGAVVSIQGPFESSANGKANASSDEPLSYTLARTIGETAATGIYGISVEVQDTNNNPGSNGESVSDEEAKIDGTKITVAKGPIADADVNNAFDKDDFTLEVKNAAGVVVATSTHITAVDASARTITISESGGATAVVSYSYAAADHTFEIDMSAPSVEFSVDEDEPITNSSPFIKVSFGDKEYPGDSHTEVALTAATLTMGDGDAMDIAGTFAKEANGHNYLWAGVNMALGEYTLTVTGEDDAGNETGEKSVTFSIVAKPATQIALNPGVNLISLPGTPATSSVEGVFGGSDVTSVLTYDPSTPTKWLAAEQAPDGSWVGNLTEVSASLGYWVTTTSFDALSVDIVSFSAGGAALPPTHNLVPGWNLVAVTTLDEVEKTGDATPVDANTYLGNNWLRAITYDAQAGRFQTQGPDDLDDDGNPPTLQVGKGYFVWMTKPHTVVP